MNNNENKGQNSANPNETVVTTRMIYIVVVSTFFALVADGMDMNMLALALPLLKNELGLNMVMTGSLGTWTLLGMAAGGSFAGWLADRYGRVKVWGVSIIVFSVLTALLALAHSYLLFVVIRTLSAVGLGAVYIMSIVLAAEYVPSKHRTTVLATLQAGWSVGYVISSLLAAWLLPLYGWRALFAIAIIPALVPIWAMRIIKEPASWAEAKAARLANPSSGSQFKQLWADKSARRTFILWTIATIALQFGYNGTSQWLPSYLISEMKVDLKSMGWYVAATYSVTIFSKIIIGWLADRIGRRVTYLIAGLATAIALPLITFYATPQTLVYVLLIFGMLYGAPYAIYSTYINESFAAKMRGTAVGTVYSIARLGASMAPIFIGAVATKYSIGLGIALMGVAYAINGLVPGIFIKEKMFDSTKE